MDMETALEGWFMMREYRAMEDFDRMWRDHEGPNRLFREVAEFWGFDDVYREEAEVPPSAAD
jgi:hypothetical protein